jgi:hypothetical protein
MSRTCDTNRVQSPNLASRIVLIQNRLSKGDYSSMMARRSRLFLLKHCAEFMSSRLFQRLGVAQRIIGFLRSMFSVRILKLRGGQK